MKLIKMFKIISYLKKGLNVKTIDEVEKAVYKFYKDYGVLR